MKETSLDHKTDDVLKIISYPERRRSNLISSSTGRASLVGDASTDGSAAKYFTLD